MHIINNKYTSTLDMSSIINNSLVKISVSYESNMPTFTKDFDIFNFGMAPGTNLGFFKHI